MLRHEDISPAALVWINDNGLRDDFDELFRVLSVYFPQAVIRKVYRDSEEDRIVCVLDEVDRTDFIVQRNRFFCAVSDTAPEACQRFKLTRDSRFGEASSSNFRGRL